MTQRATPRQGLHTIGSSMRLLGIDAGDLFFTCRIINLHVSLVNVCEDDQA